MDSLDWIKLIQYALHTNKEGAITLDYIHEKLHEGGVFLASHYFSAVANTASASVLLVTGPIAVHLVGTVQAGGQARIRIYEGAVASSVGTVLPSYNLNRVSTRTLNTKLYYTPTVAGGSEGTLIYDSMSAAGKGPQAGGGDLRRGSEYILKADTTYYFVITNTSGNAQNYAIELEYYETDEDVM